MRLLVVMVALASACGPDGVRVDAIAPFQQALRPDNPVGDMFEFDAGDVVETFDSAGGDFRVHFTRAGTHAVDLTDDSSDGTPDFVEEVALVYDQAITFYESLGFERPLVDGTVGGGSDRFDIYLVDFGGAGDGAFRVDSCDSDQCIGFMVQENDFAGYGYPSPVIGVRTVGSHELFHSVQAVYDADQGAILSEGTATWATERFAPELPDFEHQVDDYLDNPDQALDKGRGYGHAIFFQYLDERFGSDFILALWQACVNGARGVANPYWLDEIDGVLQAEAGVSFVDTFVTFATWNLYTAARADSAYYENGAEYPPVARSEVSPPYTEEMRSFYGSTLYGSARVSDRQAMTAALVADNPAELADLHLVLAVDCAGGYTEVRTLADPIAGTETVATAGANRLLVAVVNSATASVIRRPNLCIGDPDEVRACIDAILPPTPAPKDDGGCAAAAGLPWLGIPLLMRRRRRS
jgi:hypothetical protein